MDMATEMDQRFLTAHEAMEIARSLTADEAMDVEHSLTFTIDDNGVAQAQSAGSSFIWPIQLPSGQQNLQEEEEEEEEEEDDDDDEAAEFFDGNIDLFYTVVTLNLLAQQQGVDFETLLRCFFGGDEGAAGEVVGAVLVPASDAAVAGLEKQAFHATAEGRDGDESECGVTGCPICLEDFEDGEEVTVMPCSRGHEFHPECITKWLGQSNTCPLCRHALPTDVTDYGL